MTADLVIDALATARITRLLTEDRVPFGPIRDRILRNADEDSGGLGSPSRLAELVTCPWCSSVHVAIFVGIVRWRFPRAWRPVATALAMSYVAGFLAEHEGN